jgi:serine/threonine protein kinase
MTLASGTRLGPYEILAPIGAGGMGEVYRARDTKLNREVAVKVLPEHLADDADARGRFEREAQAVAALSHPNILAIHDFGVEGDVAYSVTELLEGETLRARLSGSPLHGRKAVDFALQIARGLAAAHERGIVHRDLKPETIFLTKDGHVKILDFGLARMTGVAGAGGGATNAPTVEAAGTAPGTVMGTMGYMSPEQVRGREADHRTDIFSFGAVMYEMLSGRRAFRGDSAADTMTEIL